MKKFAISFKRTYLIAILVLQFVYSESSAQNYNLPSFSTSHIAFEVMKPNLDYEGTKILSAVWYVDVQARLDDQLTFLAEVPFVYFDYEDELFGNDFNSQLMFGNLMAGMEIHGRNALSGGYGLLAVRLPLTDDGKRSAALYGNFTDFDRFDAFIARNFSFQGGAGYRFELDRSENASARLHLGGNFLVFLPLDSEVDSEAYGKYYSEFWYMAQKFNIGVGFSGNIWLTGGGYSFDERTEHQFSIDIQLNYKKIRPGAFIRFPVADDLKRIVEFVAGVNLTIGLGGEIGQNTDEF